MRVVVSVVVVLGLLSACTGGSGKRGAPASSAVTRPAPSPRQAVLPSAQASAIEQALGDGSAAKVETVLDPAVRAAFAKAPTRLLPAGSSVSIDSTALIVSGNRGQVPATVTTAQRSQKWTLLLVKDSGQWLIYGTKR